MSQNFDILGAEKKFKAYAPGGEPLQLRGSLLAESEGDNTGHDSNSEADQAESAPDSEPEPPKKENKVTEILKKPLSIFRNEP